MITTTVQALHSAIVKTLLILFFCMVAFVLLLSKGVAVDRLDLPGVYVRQLYIKLDKKLTLTAADVRLPGGRDNNRTAAELDDMGRLLKLLPALFESIRIQNLRLGNRVASLQYADNIVYLRTKEVELAAALAYDTKRRRLFADVKHLLLRKPGLRARGTFVYDGERETWKAKGIYEGLGLRGRFKTVFFQKTLRFFIDSDPCTSIKPLVDYLAPPPAVKAWIYPKIPASRYRLHYLKGALRLEKGGRIRPIITSIKGYASAWDAKIRFHDKLPPVLAKRIDVRYDKDTLSFTLTSPRYGQKNLDGSRVRIRNLTGRNGPSELDLHIVALGPFDESIRRILQTYGIDVPFIQSQGTLKGVTDLTVALKKGKVTRYNGTYLSKRAVLLFDHTLPVTVEDLNVSASGLNFAIHPCRVTLRQDVTFRTEGRLNVSNRRGDFKIFTDRMRITAGDVALLELQNETQHLLLRFDGPVRFSLPALKSTVTYRKEGGVRVRLEDISRLRHYFVGPLQPLREGWLDFNLSKRRFGAEGDLLYANDYLLKNGRPLERFGLKAAGSWQKWQATLSPSIKIEQKRGQLTIAYRDIDLKLLILKKRLEALFRNESDQNGPQNGGRFVLKGKNTTLFTRYGSLPCDTLHVVAADASRHLYFRTTHGGGEIRGAIHGQNLQVLGRRLPAGVIRSVTALKDLYGGYFDFDANGTLEDFNGTIAFKDTLWAKSAAYNNILAALNTVPAILMLKNPGFNQRGFKIRHGSILYRYRSPRFIFRQIAVYGESANIFGRGWVDFDQSTVDAKLQIQFLESLSSVMHKIPVAGYLLFGKDGTISVGLKVQGPLKDPQVTTSAAKDIVAAPFNIIKRTLTLPFHLFDAF